MRTGLNHLPATEGKMTMDDEAPGPGWWKASDGNWYSPEQRPASPVPPPPVPPTSPSTPPSSPGTAPTEPVISGGPLGEGSGGGKGGMIAAILVVVVLIAGAAVFALGGSDDDDASGPLSTRPDSTEEPDSTDDPDPTDPPETTEEPDEEEDEETPTTEAPSGDGECRLEGVDFADDMQVEILLANPLGAVPSLEVTYALTDADGVRFATGGETIDSPQRGEQFRLSSDTLEELPSSVDEDDVGCTILEVEEGFDFEYEDPGPDDECEFVELDFADDVQLEATVTNPFSDTVDLNVVYAMRGADGVRFETGTQIVDVVAPGEVVRVQIDTFDGLPDWVDEDDLTCEVIAVSSF